MTPCPARLAAVALLLVASPLRAQVSPPPPTPVALRTLVTPSLLAGVDHHCSVSNVSSQAVPLTRLDLYGAGQPLASASCAGPTASLGPGRSCAVLWTWTGDPAAGPAVHCRAQFTGAEAAVTGALQIVRPVNGQARALGSVAMQPITGVTLAP